jgi:hypothetical protein
MGIPTGLFFGLRFFIDSFDKKIPAVQFSRAISFSLSQQKLITNKAWFYFSHWRFVALCARKKRIFAVVYFIDAEVITMSISNSSIESIQVRMFPDGRLDTKNAANYLGLKEKTLAMMRANGTGPQFIKRGRVFYYKEDLDSWLNARGRCLSTAQALQR